MTYQYFNTFKYVLTQRCVFDFILSEVSRDENVCVNVNRRLSIKDRLRRRHEEFKYKIQKKSESKKKKNVIMSSLPSTRLKFL